MGVVYRPYQGRKNGKIQWGKRVKLAPYDAPVSTVWYQYECLINSEKQTLSWLFRQYFAGRDFASLKPKTQTDYQSSANKMCGVSLKDGSVFGQTHLTCISKIVIRQYLDTYPYPVAANRQVAILKAAWNWASCRFDRFPANPCLGVRLNREAPRTRYISHDELDHALSLAPPWLRVAMELAYLCRGRRSEILSLHRRSLHESGILLRRGKGSRDEITLLTPRLRSVIALSEQLEGDSDWLVRTKKGKISVSQFNSAWRRLMQKIDGEPFTFHDLKAKGLSDMVIPDAGHRSPKMLDVYLRKPKKISPDYD